MLGARVPSNRQRALQQIIVWQACASSQSTWGDMEEEEDARRDNDDDDVDDDSHQDDTTGTTTTAARLFRTDARNATRTLFRCSHASTIHLGVYMF